MVRLDELRDRPVNEETPNAGPKTHRISSRFSRAVIGDQSLRATEPLAPGPTLAAMLKG